MVDDVKTLCIAFLLLCSGCASGGGARWFAPSTWWSHAPAEAADKAEKREDNARVAVVKAAQKSTHETALALAAAPASRPVAVASDSNASAVSLLDQAAGPLTAEESARLRATVAGLLSENSAVRAQAEATRKAEQESIADVSAKLARAEQASSTAAEKLRAAFERENALANDLRAQRAALWIAGAVALLLAAGWIYAQVALGGLPRAFAGGLNALRAKGVIPPIGEPNVFDSFLNRNEQQRIARNA